MNFIEKGEACPDGFIGVIGDNIYLDDAENRAFLDLCDAHNSHCDACPHRAYCNASTLIANCLSTILNRKHLNMDATQNEADLESLCKRLENAAGIPVHISFERMDTDQFPPDPVISPALKKEKTGSKSAEPPVIDDPVNSPKHYRQGGIECIDVIEAARGREGCIQFCLGNTIKYLFRDQYKGRPLEDLKKAQWYLNYAIDLMEGK